MSDPVILVVNTPLIAGIVFALLCARWVGKCNKELHHQNVAARRKLSSKSM